MKKLLKVLTVFVVMFGFSSTVMAYDKPNGKFYIGQFGSTGEDSFDILPECRKKSGSEICEVTAGNLTETLYLLSNEYISRNKKYNNNRENWDTSQKPDDEKCYIKNIPISTKNVGFNDYRGVSTGSLLKKVWVSASNNEGVSDGHDYMAACYKNSDSVTNGKFYLFGFSTSPINATGSRKTKLCHNIFDARKSAYIYASQTNRSGENIKEKDFKYGYGNKINRVTIGASWACNGKNASGFNDCKGSSYSEAKFTDRKNCPIYAGYKNLGGDAEYYYFTNKYDSQFTSKSYTHLCVAYDADLETRIKNIFKDYENKEIPNILNDYNNGKITFAKLTKTFNDKLNEMFVKVFDGEYLGSDMYIDKDNHLAYKEGTETNHCQDYSNYISDELIDISKILELIDKNVKNAEEAEKLKGIAEGKTEEAKEEYINSAMNFLKNGFTGPGIDPKDLTCEEMLGKNLTKILKFALEVLSMAGAIIAIVNSMISLIPALIAKDAEALKKAQSKCITMAIVLVLILLLPTLLTFMGNIFGYDLTCFNWMK